MRQGLSRRTTWTRRRPNPVRHLLMAGAAMTTCGAFGADAASQIPGRSHSPTAALPDDGLGPRDLMLQADLLTQDQPNSRMVATGHVEARYQGRVLRANRLEYNTVTGAARATGGVVVVNPDGTTVYGDDITLDDQFRAAVAVGFATRQAGNTTFAAGSAVRRNDSINQLNNAVYTACAICAQDGSPKAPTWSIQASRIVEDRQHEVVYYRNALIRVLGIPVFYAPVFWHPDPSSPRRSGLLTPRIEYSRRRGFSYEQPYLQTLGPSADLIISPQVNSRVNPFVNLRYTQRFYSGLVDVRGGYTYDKNFNNHIKFGNETSRSYVLARGLFDITPQGNWVWGFGAERVSDPTLFARYGIHDVYTDRGPFPTDTDRLISQVYTVKADKQDYLSLSALDFQSLRVYGAEATGQPITENSRAFPHVAPLLEARYDPTQPVLGGQLQVRATAVALNRNDPVVAIFDPTGVVPAGPQLYTASTLASLNGLPQSKSLSALRYTDSRRVSAQLDWRTSFTLDDGLRIEPFLLGRGDVYSLTNAQVYDTATGGFVAGKDNVQRLYGAAGATVSWPFIKPVGGSSLILEPLAQVVLSPVVKVNPNIPNEDSASFEYDETNLFSVNRFAGFDLLEGGQRLNVGGRATVEWGSGRNAEITAGRTFRAQPDSQFTALSGLAGTQSDWVVAATAQPLSNISLFTRTRLDASTFAVRREEAGVGFNLGETSASVRYNLNETGLSQTPLGVTLVGRTEDIQLSGVTFVTRHWGVSANVSRDMTQNTFPVAQLGLIYRDDCIRVDLLYTHDETYGAVLGTSDSVAFRVTFSTLGDPNSLLSNNNARGSR